MCLNLDFFSVENLCDILLQVLWTPQNSSPIVKLVTTDGLPNHWFYSYSYYYMYVVILLLFGRRCHMPQQPTHLLVLPFLVPPAPRHPDQVRDLCGSCSSWPKHTILGKLSYSRTNSKWCLGSHSENLLLIWWTHLIIVAFV